MHVNYSVNKMYCMFVAKMFVFLYIPSIPLQTSQRNQFWIIFFIFLERGCLYVLTG